jgi:hypothetical protein
MRSANGPAAARAFSAALLNCLAAPSAAFLALLPTSARGAERAKLRAGAAVRSGAARRVARTEWIMVDGGGGWGGEEE